MATHGFEIMAVGDSPTVLAAAPILWPTVAGRASQLDTTLDWGLARFAGASACARDFLRLAASIYMTDSAAPKPKVSLHRELELVVHLEQPDAWTSDAVNKLCDLAHWLTGDTWSLTVVPSAIASESAQVQRLPVDRVQLLSGGLDSLCGAVIGVRDGAPIEFVGARDYSNAVSHAQNTLAASLGSTPYGLERLLFTEGSRRKNHGPRSRALFFMSLGVLHAANNGAPEMWVPENGFTSINPPLDAGRGGTLTTRSTHPETFRRVNALLTSIGIEVDVTNPFSNLTKGELVRVAGADLLNEQWKASSASSYSCGRGNVQIFGANPNLNCGLCVACVVRRGSFIAGGVADPTIYACNELSGDKLDEFVVARSADLLSIRDATAEGIEDSAVLAIGGWPVETNFEQVFSLVQRGLAELSAVPLPTP